MRGSNPFLMTYFFFLLQTLTHWKHCILSGHDFRHGWKISENLSGMKKRGMIKFKASPLNFLLQHENVPEVGLNNASRERGWLPEMPCLDSAKLAIWESGCLLRTLKCEDGYPYPLIGEQTCHWQAQLWQRQGTDSAIGGSSSCLNCQSLFRIKAVIDTATIHPAPLAVCQWMEHLKSTKMNLCFWNPWKLPQILSSRVLTL